MSETDLQFLRNLTRFLFRFTSFLDSFSYQGHKLGKDIMILHSILLKPKCSLQNIEEEIGLTKSTVSRRVDSLVQADYVKRKDDPKDRRFIRLRLTKKGREAVLAFFKSQKAYIDSISKNLSGNERLILQKALKNLDIT